MTCKNLKFAISSLFMMALIIPIAPSTRAQTIPIVAVTWGGLSNNFRSVLVGSCISPDGNVAALEASDCTKALRVVNTTTGKYKFGSRIGDAVKACLVVEDLDNKRGRFQACETIVVDSQYLSIDLYGSDLVQVPAKALTK